MARPYRLKFENACYLVTLKGVDGIGLFMEKSDADHFVELLDELAKKHQILLHAYGLAANSAVLVVETPKANLSLYLQGVQTAFARHIRQHYVQSGAIMKDRYRAKVLEKPGMLSEACAWAHAYPVIENDGHRPLSVQLNKLKSCPFSSYRFTVELAEQGITSPAELLRGYGSPVKNRIPAHTAACGEMIRDGGASFTAKVKKSTVAVGSDEFIAEMEQKHRALVSGKPVRGVRIHGKKARGLSRNKVMEEVGKAFGAQKQDFFVQRHSSVLRPVLSSFLYQYAAMTQKEIADFIKLGSAAAVSIQIKQCIQLREKDPDLDKICRKLEKCFARS